MLTALSNPDLHLLRVFVTVAEAGGFSRAQLALNVSQSTISTQMIDLETRLGMRLCRRGRAGFALTEEGHEVYQLATDLLRDCDTFVGRLNNLRGDISGELRIAVADALLGNPGFFYDRLILELRERMPSVSLLLRVMEPLEIERLVLENRLHLGIHTFPNRAPGLRYMPLFTEAQELYCGRGHPFFDAESPPAREAIESADYASRTYYGGALDAGRLRATAGPVHSDNMEGIAAAILSGRFLGHLPKQVAQPYLDDGSIQTVQPDIYGYVARFDAVFPAGARLSRAQKILEDVLSDLFEDDGGKQNR
ncbi:MAG: LysR family transcriptional regulator [Pseudomonadota bacterium]